MLNASDVLQINLQRKVKEIARSHVVCMFLHTHVWTVSVKGGLMSPGFLATSWC